MTRRLGGNGRKSLAILATLSLAATLACGGLMGCGSSSNGGTSTVDSGTGDSSPTFDSSTDSPVDSGSDTGTTTADTGPQADGPTEPAAAEPTFSPTPGPFNAAQSVTIASTTPNATIFYTTNGTQPGPTQPSSLVYATPIDISSTTTIRAVATAAGFLDSTVAVGIYTITLPVNGAGPPAPNPLAGTLNNDFHLGLTSVTPGATICFTLDGSTPTCTAGVCEGTSQTYNAQTQVPITGTVTDPATGRVTVNAIACLAGDTDGVMAAQTYTLQVAQPTIQGPAPGVLTYNAANPRGVTPTIASVTNGATGLTTINAGIGANVSCANGTPLGNPLPAPFFVSETNGASTFWVVGCKPGYAQSTVETGAFTVDLNEPTFSPLGGEHVYDAPVAVSVNDSLNLGANGEYVCVTADGSVATCGAAGACGGTGVAALGGTTTVVSFPASTVGAGQVNVNGAVLQAVACTGATNIFVDSGSFTSGAYQLKLDPIQFVPAGGTPIPASGTLPVIIKQNGGGLHYDFICSSQDGTTVPDCTCDTVAHPTLTDTVGNTATISVTASTATVMAVGCLNPPVPAVDTNVFAQSDTPPATASYQPATVMATPTITPGGTINNPVRVQFVNNEAAGLANAYFCYTTDGTAPAYASTGPNICNPAGFTGGSTTCTTSSVAPGKSSLISEGPPVTLTGTTVNAIACDAAPSPVLQASALAAPIDYTLVVGNPLISPKTPVVLGSSLTVATTTWPTATNAVSIHYSEDGTTPDCSAAYASLTVTCAGGAACTCGGLACTDPTVQPDNGPFTATYYALGGEGNAAPAGTKIGGTLNVIACATGYTSSVSTDKTTLTPFASATPSFTTPSGQYDDYITVTLSESPGTIGGWFCVGNGAGCGATDGTCSGVAVTPEASNASYALGAGSLHAGGQPNAPPSFASVAATGVTLPSTTLANTLTAVACQPTAPAQPTILSSTAGDATYTFQTSAVSLSSPVPSANLTGSMTLTFNETATTNAPDGSPVGPVLGATNGLSTITGLGTYVCATTAALPAQPSSCGDLTLIPGIVCAKDTAVQGSGKPGPILTIPDVGADVTYNIVACKDFMVWSTSTATVSFAPYSHTIAMTGSAADFNATSESIAATDGGTAYVSWDTANLYLGLALPVPLTTADVVQVYVGSSNGTGTSTADTLAPVLFTGLPPTFPANFNALYHVFWAEDNSAQGIDHFAGSWQTTANPFEVKFNLSSNFVEFAIPLTSLVGVGNDLHLLGGDWDGANEAEWPSAAGNNDGQNWLGWQAEFLNDAFAPNDPINLNKN